MFSLYSILCPILSCSSLSTKHSAYPALVETLKELFASGEVSEFLMAWNRRISASSSFFEMMRDQGFLCHHHGQCIYSFFTARSAENDAFLQALNVTESTSFVPKY